MLHNFRYGKIHQNVYIRFANRTPYWPFVVVFGGSDIGGVGAVADAAVALLSSRLLMALSLLLLHLCTLRTFALHRCKMILCGKLYEDDERKRETESEK